ILRAQLPSRLRLSDAERSTLAEIAKAEANAGGVGIQTPAPDPGTYETLASSPSSVRAAIRDAAAASPTATPASLALAAPMADNEAANRASRSLCWAGKEFTRIRWAAATAADSKEAFCGAAP